MQSGFEPMMGVLFIGLVIALYTWYVWNDMTRRWQRLLSLAATVKTMRLRRFGVVKAAAIGVSRAARHEQQVARLGSRRGRGSGRFVAVTDNANGWPTAAAVGSANQGVSLAADSLDHEAAAWQSVQREAEEYNTLLRSFPRCMVADMLGFKPWSFGSNRHQGKPQRRWRRR